MYISERSFSCQIKGSLQKKRVVKVWSLPYSLGGNTISGIFLKETNFIALK